MQRATHRWAEAQVHTMRDGHQFQAGAIMRQERKFKVRCWCGGSLPFEQTDNRLGAHDRMWVKLAEVGLEERSGISDSQKFLNLTQWGLLGRSPGAFGLAQLPEVPDPASSRVSPGHHTFLNGYGSIQTKILCIQERQGSVTHNSNMQSRNTST